jgi:hypothetical protein
LSSSPSPDALPDDDGAVAALESVALADALSGGAVALAVGVASLGTLDGSCLAVLDPRCAVRTHPSSSAQSGFVARAAFGIVGDFCVAHANGAIAATKRIVIRLRLTVFFSTIERAYRAGQASVPAFFTMSRT